jgi:hypothetical protein
VENTIAKAIGARTTSNRIAANFDVGWAPGADLPSKENPIGIRIRTVIAMLQITDPIVPQRRRPIAPSPWTNENITLMARINAIVANIVSGRMMK